MILIINEATSVSVERIFSSETDLVTAKRCSLKEVQLEHACVGIKYNQKQLIKFWFYNFILILYNIIF